MRFMALLLPDIWRTSCCMSSNCLSSLLISTTLVPAPAAMRFLRLEFRMAGLSRSPGVMDWMIASMRPMAFSSTFAPERAFASMPGIMPAMSCREPMPLSCWSWS